MTSLFKTYVGLSVYLLQFPNALLFVEDPSRYWSNLLRSFSIILVNQTVSCWLYSLLLELIVVIYFLILQCKLQVDTVFCFLWIESVFLLDSIYLASWQVPISTGLRSSVDKQCLTLGEFWFIQGRARKQKGNVVFADLCRQAQKQCLSTLIESCLISTVLGCSVGAGATSYLLGVTRNNSKVFKNSNHSESV